MGHSKQMNKGKAVGLLRGAGTRFATWFYAMHRLLRQKKVLLATIHGPHFDKLSHNARTAICIQDVGDPVFWKAIYYLLRAVFPALRALRLCDANVPAMDKIHYLALRAEQALTKSVEFLDDMAVFGKFTNGATTGVDIEMGEVFGEEAEYDEYDDEDESIVESDIR